MNVQQRNIINQYINAYNNFDLDGMTNYLDRNIVFENVSNGTVDLRTEGLDAFRKQAEQALQYFTQRKQTIESWEFHGEKVIINIRYRAILAVDLSNGFKSGDTLELAGKSEFTFERGRILKIRDESE